MKLNIGIDHIIVQGLVLFNLLNLFKVKKNTKHFELVPDSFILQTDLIGDSVYLISFEAGNFD